MSERYFDKYDCTNWISSCRTRQLLARQNSLSAYQAVHIRRNYCVRLALAP